jgi:hypothetical protein
MKNALATEPQKVQGKHRFMAGTCIDCGHPLDPVCNTNVEALAPHPEVKPPTPDEIDLEIVAYEVAVGAASIAEVAVKAAKERLIFLADSFGTIPPHAELSKRLSGRRNTLTVTRGFTTSVNEPAIADLKFYHDDHHLNFFDRLFAVQTKHQMIEGARDVLKTISLPKRVNEKVLSLFGRCIDMKPIAPKVKIEVIKQEKAAKRTRTGKAAAA